MESPTIEILEKEITEYQKVGRVSLMGNFNVRTGTKLDYICNDDDVLLPHLMYIMQIAKCLREWAVMIEFMNSARKC